jgi:hypothetical protein
VSGERPVQQPYPPQMPAASQADVLSAVLALMSLSSLLRGDRSAWCCSGTDLGETSGDPYKAS